MQFQNNLKIFRLERAFSETKLFIFRKVILESIAKTITNRAIIFSINKAPLKRGETKDEATNQTNKKFTWN
jgi:hypothetical protein